MRIALAQTNCLIADFSGIAENIRSYCQQAVESGADLVVFPELASIGYPPRDLVERRWLIEQQWLMVNELAKDLPLPALIGCIEPLGDGAGAAIANAVVLCADGTIQASYHKRLLPTYDVFDEHRYFQHGNHSTIIELHGKKIGLTICEDIWSSDFTGVRYGQDPVGDLCGQCDVVINVSASPYAGDKPQRRRQLVETVAKRAQAPVVYVNQVGAHDELLFDGDSCAIGPDGTWYAQAPRWQESLVIADLSTAITPQPAPESTSDIYDALVMGIRDYCEKTRQNGVVLGLSGGIDSAVVAALAVDALGADKVHGILMPGPYSSDHSVKDAQDLADNLGITAHTCRIGDAVAAMESSLAEPFAGTEPNVAEENVQARLRGTMVMAYANKFNLMALTTGNKSEIAVGYCTIYGDMNGGLAPLGDVYKTVVWELAHHANAHGERIPANSISKPPSAELRPDQQDTDSLPPYDRLDTMLKAYLEHGASIADLITLDGDKELVHRMIRLVELNEYKRRQAAPVLRVTEKAFGVGRRMPVVRALHF